MVSKQFFENKISYNGIFRKVDRQMSQLQKSMLTNMRVRDILDIRRLNRQFEMIITKSFANQWVPWA